MPLVSALVSVHNDARHVGEALESVLRQTVRDLELIVVDDGSTDETPRALAGISDPRLVVVTNERQLGLAASLNHGLAQARGRYVARLDSDDVALPDWLELLLARATEEPDVAIVGTGIVEIDAAGRPGPVHRLPRGAIAVRWHALFSAPFFHSTVLVDREVLDAHGLRYDPSYLESEDYELWTRLLAFANGDNLSRPLVLRRMHPAQAQARRGDLQRSFQRDVALREIARIAPDLGPAEAELAWRVGAGLGAPAGPFVAVLEGFERLQGVDGSVRRAAARSLGRAGHVGRGLRLAPSTPFRLAGVRTARAWETRNAHRRAADWLDQLRPGRRLRVAVVSPEPTPYRAPLFDRIAARPDLDLTVIYAARTVARRTWSVELRHRAVYLEGIRLPGLRRVFRHDYPLTPAVRRALREARPDVVVVSGWSTFASQVAAGWARARRLPYVVLVESHDLGPRPAWRRAVKRAVVSPLLRGAAGVLAVGTAARESVVARGAATERVRVFANTIDVGTWIERAGRLERRPSDDEVVVLSVARLVPEKGLDLLVRAVAAAGDGRLRLVIAGDGPERQRLIELAEQADVRLTLRGDLSEDMLAQEYVDADVFALLSLHEPWGVVVNEAAASGLPLVLSDQVGAAYDLLREGENGLLVPAGDIAAAAAALRALAADPERRRRLGEGSRELVCNWGYGPSVEGFVDAVREATAR